MSIARRILMSVAVAPELELPELRGRAFPRSDRRVVRRTPRRRAAFARDPVLLAVLALLIVLAATCAAYGYHRDELYFRMLRPAWGYLDQPPLTPLLVHGIAQVVDTVWAIRIPAMVFAAVSVIVVARITQEVGGGRGAQALAAWGYAFADFTLINGHSMFTATLDLVVWPLVLLYTIRAVLREDGRWLLGAALVAGLSLTNKLLVAELLVAIVVGLAVLGPRRRELWRWGLGATAIVLVLGVPELVYQASTGWPQLEMGSVLSAQNGAAVRPFVVPYLAVLLGPVLVPVWGAGLVALVRRPGWRPLRWLALTFVVVVAVVVAMGAQLYYDYGALTAVYAVGCVPVAEWARTRGRRGLLIGGVALNAVLCGIVALPIVPVGVVGRTPIPGINQAARDTIGWPQYVADVDAESAAHAAHTIVLTTNYGEAAAINAYSPVLAARTYSGHNALAGLTPPPATTRSVVTVGHGMEWAGGYFARCRTIGRLDNGLGVASEEQGAPIRLCTGRTRPMAEIWARAAHLR